MMKVPVAGCLCAEGVNGYRRGQDQRTGEKNGKLIEKSRPNANLVTSGRVNF